MSALTFFIVSAVFATVEISVSSALRADLYLSWKLGTNLQLDHDRLEELQAWLVPWFVIFFLSGIVALVA